MDVQLTVEQNNLITSIAENEGFNEFDITTSSGSSKGDHYMGVITKVSVKNHHRKLELIMKTAPTNTKLRDIIPESVIFENLKEIGYDLWDRKKPMNWDHIVLVLKEYGKLHAVSLAMKEKNPGLYERLTEDMENLYIKMYEGDDETKRKKMEDAKKFVGVGIKALKGHQSAMEALERFSLTAYEYMNKDIAMKEDALVFLHGDCWCNNILFKYEDPTTKTPSKACLIDWQLSWTGSPAMDLAYFLFTCAPKEILADYEKCLRIYHEAACETLTSIGCDPRNFVSF
ncbi:hypothetical protein NQ318_013333 [Aromia moschata]|uniref:CHK kinase-like domain-containing protein n=1 Tax=Aromia moschata TaxID=1265417 RepID=A0AAV8XW77_9CUCU|nr:hypothetical protein NQ318_013333 [Aromia moschata]